MGNWYVLMQKLTVAYFDYVVFCLLHICVLLSLIMRRHRNPLYALSFRHVLCLFIFAGINLGLYYTAKVIYISYPTDALISSWLTVVKIWIPISCSIRIVVDFYHVPYKTALSFVFIYAVRKLLDGSKGVAELLEQCAAFQKRGILIRENLSVARILQRQTAKAYRLIDAYGCEDEVLHSLNKKLFELFADETVLTKPLRTPGRTAIVTTALRNTVTQESFDAKFVEIEPIAPRFRSISLKLFCLKVSAEIRDEFGNLNLVALVTRETD